MGKINVNITASEERRQERSFGNKENSRKSQSELKHFDLNQNKNV